MFDFPPPDPGIEIVIASRGMSQGLVQTEGTQVVMKGTLQIGAVQIGGQWKNVTSPVAEGVAMAFANTTRKLGPFQLTLSAAYKFQTRVRGNVDGDALEFTGVANRRFGKLGMRASLAYSPDDIGGTRRSFYVEGGPTLDVSKTAKVFASIGRRARVGSPDYTSFHAGVSTILMKGVTIEARYHDTAQHELGEAYHGRTVLSARLNF